MDDPKLIAQDIADRIVRSVEMEEELRTLRSELDQIRSVIPTNFHPKKSTYERVQILGSYVKNVKEIAGTLKDSAKVAQDALTELTQTSNK